MDKGSKLSGRRSSKKLSGRSSKNLSGRSSKNLSGRSSKRTVASNKVSFEPSKPSFRLNTNRALFKTIKAPVKSGGCFSGESTSSTDYDDIDDFDYISSNPEKIRRQMEKFASGLDGFNDFLIGRWGLRDGYKMGGYEADLETSTSDSDSNSGLKGKQLTRERKTIKGRSGSQRKSYAMKDQMKIGAFPPPRPFDYNEEDDTGPADSDWSIEDEYQKLPRIALSSTSPSDRSDTLVISESDNTDDNNNGPAKKKAVRIPTFEKIGDVHIYKEEIVDMLMYKHFKDDNDGISVSSVEQVEYLQQHGWDMNRWFRIKTLTQYIPSITHLTQSFRKYLLMALVLQMHHLIFAIMWSFMCFKFFSLDMDEVTFAFYYFGSYMRPVMAFEAAINWYLPVLGYFRHSNQSIRNLIILHDISYFLNLFHLILLVPCSGLNIYVFFHIDDYVEERMDIANVSALWNNTQTYRQCCGIRNVSDWKFQNPRDDFPLPDSCCNQLTLQGKCLANSTSVWGTGCYMDYGEYWTLGVFSISFFLLIFASFYHNVASYRSLKIVRNTLKNLKPELIYGIPKWVETRHTTPQYNYGLPLPDRETERNLEHTAAIRKFKSLASVSVQEVQDDLA